jgi:hypothetical protein
VKSVFLSALALPRDEREALLSERCRGDDELRREVESLLLHHEQLEGADAVPGADPSGDAIPASLGGYRILGELGRGGMGVIYRARRDDEAPIALKVLRPGLLSPEVLARFDRESEALARLRHPGIAKLLETGTFETPSGPRPYFAMELVEGEDLRSWSGRPHPLEEKLELLARTCEAVEHAHAQGVVHRDLKPENVLVRADGTPCVLDFGVARLAGPDRLATAGMTSTGVLVGTVRYMSPEQADARRGAVDARSDVYALGVVAHELCSGSMPYEVPDDSLHRALVAVLTSPPRPLEGVPGPRRRPLEAVLGQAMAKSPAGRYASAAELAADLRRVAAGGRPRARAPLPPGGGLLPLGLVALAALAGLAVVLTFRWPAARPIPASQRSPALAGAPGATRAIARLNDAAADMEATPRTAAHMRAALARCESARHELAGGGAAARTLERLAWTLEMNAHLWTADFELDPREYDACIAAGEKLVGLPEPSDPQERIPGASAALAERFERSRGRHAEGTMALAASRLALFREPWTMQRRALAWNEAALERFDEGAARARAAGGPPPPPAARRALLGERANMLVRAAALADSAPLVREAMRLLALGRSGSEPEARGSAPVLVRWGCAWAERARIEGEPAGFDSSLAHLGLAVERSRTETRPVFETISRIWLARVLCWRARSRPDRAAARRDLRAALASLERRLAEPPGPLSPRALGLLRLERAEVHLELAGLERTPALAESALAAVSRLRPLFPPELHPVVCSDLELASGRARAILWRARPDASQREAARRDFRTAASRVAASEDPGRARRIRAALDALASDAPGGASGGF